MCHDDLHFHCARERDRHDGGAACLAHAAVACHSGQAGALFRLVVCQPAHHPASVGLCLAGAGGGQSVGIGGGVRIVYCRIFVIRAAHLHADADSGGCHACVGFGADDAYHVVVGHDISHREHAGIVAGVVSLGAGALVYLCGAQADDYGSRCGLCVAGSRRVVADGSIVCKHKFKKVQGPFMMIRYLIEKEFK